MRVDALGRGDRWRIGVAKEKSEKKRVEGFMGLPAGTEKRPGGKCQDRRRVLVGNSTEWPLGVIFLSLK